MEQNQYNQNQQPAHNIPYPQGPAPMPQAAVYAPVPVVGYTTGQKFGWVLLGFLMGIPSILVAWLCNVPNPAYRSDAIKFTVIGLVVNILCVVVMWGMFMSIIAGITSGLGSSSYAYGA